ncbi:MAG: HAD-IIIA family hydrolase [Planctomycetes bacterium]|nr:HAD-IIIA family hydrolase [Planctomycetota bacterium]
MGSAPANFGVLGALRIPLALGVLKLSTEGRPERAEAIRVIQHALDRGIRVLDTADSYGLNAKDLHYGEHLVRDAVESWSGDAAEVRVITKAGLARPKGRWLPSGRPESLRKAVEGSLQALGVEQLFMLLLHVKDYRIPFEDSLGALAELQRAGKIKHLGLCNVTVPEVRQAQRHFEVEALQCELSVMSRKAATTGVVALAQELGIPFLAHRPLGGHAKVDKLLKNRAMKPLVKKHGVPPHEVALATLLDLGQPVIPLFGASRTESVDSSLRALTLRLDSDDRTLRAKISFQPTPAALESLRPHVIPTTLRPLVAGEGPGQEPEVVLVTGVQGAGKSSRVEPYLAAGYARLNRDLLGGKLDDLVPQLADLLAQGQQRVVLDNTYPSWIARHAVLRAAHAHNVPVRCIHMATPINEALVNVVLRVLERYGRLLAPDELTALAKSDPNLPPPAALATYMAKFEQPRVDEGFSVVEEAPFTRRPEPTYSGKGLLLDIDGTLRGTFSGAIYPTDPADVVLLPNRRETLQTWLDQGYQLFLISNQSGIASGKVSQAAVEACILRTVELLGLPVTEVRYCPHKAFPTACYCRKPMPGFGVALIQKYELSREHLVMVGDMESDARFADAIGATYHSADEFFAG